MIGRRSLLALGLLAGSACGDGVAFLSSSGLSMVIVLELDGQVARGAAVDVRGSALFQQQAPPGELFVLAFEQLPASVPFGALTLGSTGDALPLPDRLYRLEGSTLVELDSPPPAFEGLRVAPPDGCLTFEALKLPFPAQANFAVPLGRDRALIGSPGGRFFDVAPGAFRELTTLSTTTPSFAGFTRGDEVFLVGSGRSFVRGHPDRGFVDGPPLARRLMDGAVLDGAREPDALELFVTDASLAVQHFDGVQWRLIREPSSGGSENTRAGLAWSEPGKAILIGVEDSTVLEIDASGVVRSIRLELDADLRGDGGWSALHVDGVGAVVGTTQGSVHTRGTGAWTKRPDSSTGPRLDVLIDLGDRTIMGGGDLGVFVQWGPGDAEVCAPITGFGTDIGYAASPLGDGFVNVNGSGALGYQLIFATPPR